MLFCYADQWNYIRLREELYLRLGVQYYLMELKVQNNQYENGINRQIILQFYKISTSMCMSIGEQIRYDTQHRHDIFILSLWHIKERTASICRITFSHSLSILASFKANTQQCIHTMCHTRLTQRYQTDFNLLFVVLTCAHQQTY